MPLNIQVDRRKNVAEKPAAVGGVRQRVKKFLRRPKDRRFVFIITYGRSGSTLLMNLINSSDGCCIRGENKGALHHIYQSYKSLVDAQKSHGANSLKSHSPWLGLQSVNTDNYARKLVRSFIDEVLRPAPRDEVCGFKEIRYSRRDVPDLAGYLSFLEKFFPNAKFVFNHRRLEDVAKSKWWATMPEALTTLKDFEGRLNEFQSSTSRFHFSYDLALENRSHVRELFQFLKLPYSEDVVEGVFSRRHSY